jgi:large subunit ribosomal protein L11
MLTITTTLDITHIKKCFIMSNNAEPSPPLGTILGNLGVNTIKFCEEFNKVTKNLPLYFLLKTQIFIYENRSFTFKLKCSSTCFFLNLLKFEKTIKIRIHDRFHEKVINCILLKDILQLALFKYPNYNIKKSILII